MQAELFTGTYQALTDRINAIIALPRTINDVIVLSKGVYVILHT